MAFSWSFPKLMVILTLGFFLFGVPLITWLMVLRDRRRRAASPPVRGDLPAPGGPSASAGESTGRAVS